MPETSDGYHPALNTRLRPPLWDGLTRFSAWPLTE